MIQHEHDLNDSHPVAVVLVNRKELIFHTLEEADESLIVLLEKARKVLMEEEDDGKTIH